MQEGLCRDISLKPFMGGRKVAVIDDADDLNAEGANSLLKTLEEPPPASVLILIGTSPAKQLPTIRSRCQLVRFQALPSETIAKLLLAQGTVTSDEEARRLAGNAEGSLKQALELADPQLWTFRETLLGQLAEPQWDSLRLAKAVQVFVEEAGKEAALRRGRLRRVVRFAAEFYRRLLHELSGGSPAKDAQLEDLVGRAREHWSKNGQTAAACLDRCVEAEGQIGRNANQTTLIECWLDDLVRITSR